MKSSIKKITIKLFSILGYDIKFYSKTDLYSIDPITIQKLVDLTKKIDKIQYGSGVHYIMDWLNVDFSMETSLDKNPYYLKYDLTRKHPFNNNTFQFAYSEDFIEHLTQADQLIFLSEVYRTLKKGGVIRLSYPNLENLLKTHYTQLNYEQYILARKEGFYDYGHLNYLCEQEIILMAKHIGFSNIKFFSYKESDFEELRNRETRINDPITNTCVELIK